MNTIDPSTMLPVSEWVERTLANAAHGEGEALQKLAARDAELAQLRAERNEAHHECARLRTLYAAATAELADCRARFDATAAKLVQAQGAIRDALVRLDTMQATGSRDVLRWQDDARVTADRLRYALSTKEGA